jgi:hypothetical protein
MREQADSAQRTAQAAGSNGHRTDDVQLVTKPTERRNTTLLAAAYSQPDDTADSDGTKRCESCGENTATTSNGWCMDCEVELDGADLRSEELHA